MSNKHIRGEVVRQTLKQLGPVIRTKDVSSHPLMLAGHRDAVNQNNYHASVGTFLSKRCDGVRRVSEVPENKTGAQWRNLLSGQDQQPVDTEDLDPGPQRASDGPFKARMRLHQSWYRAHVLQVPYGTGPDPDSTRYYGNMLRPQEAERGLNFLTPEILQAARRRLDQRSGTVGPFRLLHNMLSSQPLCFNLFAPLAMDLQLATHLLRALPGLSADRALRVELEFTPDAYLDDHTAFDAYIEYEQSDGRRAFLGIEVKLTEPFSKKAYDSPNYRGWMTGPRSPWRQDAAEQTSKRVHNQLWRDHLLVIAHRDQQGSPYANGRLMLVRHPGERSCEQVVGAYAQLLREDDDTLIDMPLDRLIAIWEAAVWTDAQHAWLTALKERYLDLDKSLPLWAAMR